MADTRTITPNSLALAACIMAAVLVTLAFPRFMAATAVLDAAQVVDAADNGRPVTAAELADAVRALQRALSWSAEGETQTALGLLLMVQAQAAPADAERNALAERAIAALEAGLRRSPGQPEAWLRLARLRDMTGNPAKAVAALRLSILSGGYLPYLMGSRLALALRLRPFMTDDDQAMVMRQIRLTWIADANAVTALAQRPDTATVIARALNQMTDDEMTGFIRARAAGQ